MFADMPSGSMNDCYFGFLKNGIVSDVAFAMGLCVNDALGFVHTERDIAFLFAWYQTIANIAKIKSLLDSQSLSSCVNGI